MRSQFLLFDVPTLSAAIVATPVSFFAPSTSSSLFSPLFPKLDSNGPRQFSKIRYGKAAQALTNNSLSVGSLLPSPFFFSLMYMYTYLYSILSRRFLKKHICKKLRRVYFEYYLFFNYILYTFSCLVKVSRDYQLVKIHSIRYALKICKNRVFQVIYLLFEDKMGKR